MRYTSILVIIVVIISLSIGWWLLPNQTELGFIHLKNKEYEQAFKIYQQLYQDGDHSIQIVIPLIKIALLNGNVDQAVVFAEQAIVIYPDNIDIRVLLGKLYHFAQRPDDYLINLKNLIKIKPTLARYKEISQIYNFKQQYDEQIQVLIELNMLYPDQVDAFRDLIYLQASQRQFKKRL